MKFPSLEASKHTRTAICTQLMAPWGAASAGYNTLSLQEPSPHSLSVSCCLFLHSRTSRTILSASLAAGNEASSSPTWCVSQALAPDRQIDVGDEMQSDPSLPQNSHQEENFFFLIASFSLFFPVLLHFFPLILPKFRVRHRPIITSTI